MNRELLIEELRKLKKEGKLHAEAVVEAARPDDSPLHDYFEWNDDAAAAKFRIVQARELIRTVRVFYPETKDHRPVFVSLQPDRQDEGGYRELRDVLASDALRDELLRTLLGELQAMQERYKVLTEMAPIFASAVAAVESKIATPKPAAKKSRRALAGAAA